MSSRDSDTLRDFVIHDVTLTRHKNLNMPLKYLAYVLTAT